MNLASLRRARVSGAGWRGIGLAAPLRGVPPAAHATTTPYLEASYGGDFSNDSSAPTQLIPNPPSAAPLPFPMGDNIVSGTTGAGDNDYFSFTVAPGEFL